MFSIHFFSIAVLLRHSVPSASLLSQSSLITALQVTSLLKNTAFSVLILINLNLKNYSFLLLNTEIFEMRNYKTTSFNLRDNQKMTYQRRLLVNKEN
jgi:hypothetical protein